MNCIYCGNPVSPDLPVCCGKTGHTEQPYMSDAELDALIDNYIAENGDDEERDE